MDSNLEAEAKLRRALDFIPKGLAVFNADLRLVATNARYGELLELPAELLAPGTALYDLVLYVGRRGDLGSGDVNERARERLAPLGERAMDNDVPNEGALLAACLDAYQLVRDDVQPLLSWSAGCD